ncbi:hypothetical protein SARC_09020 [Sphaeroforma arctica JP610]|uniref:EGF-like domain-containing protein n=1 Tax=Sphaeroforma arctica JP610 TaxID=667725 RepID=A0A0L0FPD3_9EUKA|nr:hypothetical protein SARC_09020 [Sphaeroforma arctica JP610]KNC78559.1 hypothetical protein SARC_09020 [Sphaeroforma arctica JP610]|eukprot:XP_014152461.1 hypothetical protein SARC_09020 [Sphaeroforma arctica JP610]
MIIINKSAISYTLLLCFSTCVAGDCGTNGEPLANKADSCLCTSSYYGTNCESQLSNASTCATWNDHEIQLEIKTSATLHTENKLVDDQYVHWEVSVPVGANRTYTRVKVGTCVDGANLQVFEQKSDPCADKLIVQMSVSFMAGSCGFSLTKTIANQTQYNNYTSSISLHYSEPTTVATNIVTRTANVLVPINVLIESQFSAQTSEVEVFSPFEITAALSALTVVPGSTLSTMLVSYVVAYPYTVTGANPILTSSTENTASICKTDNAGDCGAIPFVADACDADEYTQTDKSCLKSFFVRVLHGECELTGNYTIKNVAVACHAGLPDQDCPIREANNSSSIDFSVTSDNFCDFLGIQTIDRAVSIERFVFVDPENRQRDAESYFSGDAATGSQVLMASANIPNTALVYNQNVYGRIDFGGIDVKSVDIVRSQVKLEGDADWVDSINLPDSDVSISLTAGVDYPQTREDNYESSLSCAKLGLCFDDQSFLIRFLLDDSLVPPMTNPGLGNTKGLDYRLTIEVSYDSIEASNRRRKRQTSADPGSAGNHGSAMVWASATAKGTEEETASQQDDGNASTSHFTTMEILACALFGQVLLYTRA